MAAPLAWPPSASDWAQSSTVGDLYEPSSNGLIKRSNPVFRANDPRLSELTKAYQGRSERTTGKQKDSKALAEFEEKTE